MTEVVREIALDEVARRRQNDTQATLAPRLKKSDGRIDWDRTAAEVYNRIRGTTPWPGAFAHLAVSGKPPLRLVIEKAALSPTPARGDPGTVLAAGPEGIDVAAAKGAIRLAGTDARRQTQDVGRRLRQRLPHQARLAVPDRLGPLGRRP